MRLMTRDLVHQVQRLQTLIAFREADRRHIAEVARREPLHRNAATVSLRTMTDEISALQRQLADAQWRLALGRLLWASPAFGH